MTQYDPKIIQELADRLYKSANQVVVQLTIILGIFGAVIGVVIGKYMYYSLDMPYWLTGLIVAVLTGCTGYLVGKERAFALKYQAQTALCQMSIEQNTAGKTHPPSIPLPPPVK
jgi:uncharacterized membrane protein YeaQ/YmgE (transglycosylase-associated protein family)